MLLLLSLLAACYLPPVSVPIAEPFVAPACPFCPGHRGVEYDLEPGTPVSAAAGGVVTFSGVVAGTRYVVVEHADGIRATYGLLGSTTLGAGAEVGAGDVVGRSTGRLYFGLRAPDDTPLDPADYLAVVTRRARLVPMDGSPWRPASERGPSCPNLAAQNSAAQNSAAQNGAARRGSPR